MIISSIVANDGCETYRAWIPGDVCKFGADFGGKVKHKNDQDNQRADHSPHGLPEDVGFVSNHEFNIFVKPVTEKRYESGLKSYGFHGLVDVWSLVQDVLTTYLSIPYM